MSELNYSVKLLEYDDESFTLRFEFENPLSVSKGADPDTLSIEFVDPELFVS